MKYAVATIAFVGMSWAYADIPLPHNPAQQTESTSVTYSGIKAQQEFDSIAGNVIPGSSSGWSGEVESYKVERSQDGLEQTVCSLITNYRTKVAPKYSCTQEISLNGQPLPIFKPIIRMG
jgi:hypothetical protein